jgi:hypothetical protein
MHPVKQTNKQQHARGTPKLCILLRRHTIEGRRRARQLGFRKHPWRGWAGGGRRSCGARGTTNGRPCPSLHPSPYGPSHATRMLHILKAEGTAARWRKPPARHPTSTPSTPTPFRRAVEIILPQHAQPPLFFNRSAFIYLSHTSIDFGNFRGHAWGQPANSRCARGRTTRGCRRTLRPQNTPLPTHNTTLH